MLIVLGYILASLVGISLGLVGSGGSILAVPILYYLFGVTPELATTYSLCIVGSTASVGAYKHYRLGNLQLKPALTFAIPSLIMLLLTRKYIVPAIPQELLTLGSFTLTKSIFIMVIFAILMIAASLSMIKSSSSDGDGKSVEPLQLVLISIIVGLVTGFLGAGGGFLIIPALIFFAGLPMKRAVGTSLLIISFNALIGFAGDLVKGVQVDLVFLATFTAIAIGGMFFGTYLSKRIDGNKLKPIFGWLVLIMGIYIILMELFFKIPSK